MDAAVTAPYVFTPTEASHEHFGAVALVTQGASHTWLTPDEARELATLLRGLAAFAEFHEPKS
jgi:hypothetical protein